MAEGGEKNGKRKDLRKERVNNFSPHKCFISIFLFILPSIRKKKKTLKLRQNSKMPFPNPLLDSYNCSVLLRNTMCTEHVLKSESQELKFPSYTSVSLYEENQPRKFLMNTLIGHCGPWRGLLSCAKLSAKPCQCIFYTKVPRVGY